MSSPTKIPSFKLYLFDVDGTLTHSAPDICGAIQQVIAPHLNGKEITNDFLTTYIGRHLLDLFQDLFPAYSAEQIEDLITEYRQVYPARNHDGTVVFPGVLEALAKIGGKKSTATTKGTPTTRVVLEKFGLLPFFDHVQGTDGFPAKPAPDVIFRSLDLFEVKPEECLFIGDAPADMEAGKRAGVTTCAVTYGYGSFNEMKKFSPDYWINDLRDLV